MRKLIFILVILMFASPAWAAGTASQTNNGSVGPWRWNDITFTADAADGSYPSFASQSISGLIVAIETKPGGTDPTTGYDISVVNDKGISLSTGLLDDRNLTGQRAEMSFLNTGALTIAITGNSVNSAVINMRIWYTRKDISMTTIPIVETATVCTAEGLAASGTYTSGAYSMAGDTGAMSVHAKVLSGAGDLKCEILYSNDPDLGFALEDGADPVFSDLILADVATVSPVVPPVPAKYFQVKLTNTDGSNPVTTTVQLCVSRYVQQWR